LRKPENIGKNVLVREVDHGPSKRKIVDKGMDPKARENLYNSTEQIKTRSWHELFAMPDSEVSSLDAFYEDLVKDTATNRPLLRQIDRVLQMKRRPLMLCEYGFGGTTVQLLKWCVKNDAYLVTVDMPIAPPAVRACEDYNELYWWGVDRYWKKYKWCMELMDHPVAQKRWLWINDDCYKVTDSIVKDKEYRQQLFFRGKIDYFYEDAIHDNVWHAKLFKSIKPFMTAGSVFTGDDNTPTHLL